MGHCDSSAQHGGHGEICAASGRSAEAASARVADRTKHSIGAWALLVLVRAYVVFLSPIFGGACRFYPSCSNYAYEAVSKHGGQRGFVLAVKRLLRCRPFTPGGYDPVPEVLYKEDTLQELPESTVQIATSTNAHRPTQAVVTETWSAAGSLGVERRL